jgi:hypothetical protein
MKMEWVCGNPRLTPSYAPGAPTPFSPPSSSGHATQSAAASRHRAYRKHGQPFKFSSSFRDLSTHVPLQQQDARQDAELVVTCVIAMLAACSCEPELQQSPTWCNADWAKEWPDSVKFSRWHSVTMWQAHDTCWQILYHNSIHCTGSSSVAKKLSCSILQSCSLQAHIRFCTMPATLRGTL